jgi:hypothetical protein
MMANINQIDLRIRTGDRPGAGSDARFYFGIGGREFRLNIPGTDDFKADSDQTFILGTSSNIENPTRNNPSTPFQLVTENLDRYPKYIRFEPENDNDEWNLESITVTVNPGTGEVVFSGLRGPGANLWLGARSTKVFYFGA